MSMRMFLLSAALGAAGVVLALPATAAPLSPAQTSTSLEKAVPQVEAVHYRRRHWRHYGYRPYNDYGYRPYYYRSYGWYGPRLGFYGRWW